MILSRFLQYAFIAIVITTVGFSLYQWNASRAALKVNTNQNLNTNGLVGHWTLDGADTVWTSSTAGTTLDTSGSGNTGTLSNMNRATTPTLGKLGQAMTFDRASSTGVTIASSTPYTGTVLTFSVWAKRSAFGSGYSGYALYSAGTVSPGVSLEFDDTNHMCIYAHAGGTLSGSGLCTTATYTDTAWHQYVGVADGTNLKIYVDTKLVASSVQTITSSEIKNAGRIGNTMSRFFSGTIDDVRVYNRALSENEITDLYRMSGVKENTSALQPQGIGNLNSGLTGYWKFDDGSGSTAADSSGNGNTGTLVNTPTWTTGQIGGGIGLLNASAQYVSLGNPSTYDLTSTGQLTVSAWVKTGSSIINSTLGIVKRGATNTVGAPDQYALTSSNTRWRFMAGNGTTYAEVFGPGSQLVPDTWYHLTGVIDAANLSLYVNGVSAATPVARPAGSPPASVSNFIGSVMAGGPAWDGTIDEVRIYNRALSADEISRLYRLTTPTGVDTSLKGYWSLDGNATNWTSSTTGTTADLSSYNNTGTLTSMNRATTPTLGKLGQALNFSGDPSNVVISGDTPFDLNSTLTISAWIRWDGTGTWEHIAGKRNLTDFSYQLRLNSSQKVSFLTTTGTPVDGNVPPVNGWQHVVVVYSGGTATIYQDGIQTATGSGLSITNNNVNFTIGNPADLTQVFNGKIDEIRMYDRVLSLPEITDLYQTGVKKINTTQDINTNGLVGHWSFDGKDTVWSSASAGTTLDTSGNGNTGTLTNMNRATSPAIGKLGQSMDFVAAGGQKINFGSPASLDDLEAQGGGGMTISTWINPRTSGAGEGTIINKGNASNTSNGAWSLKFYNSIGRFGFEKSYTTTVLARVALNGTISYNKWQHVIVTWDGSATATNIHMYVDGTEVSYQAATDGVGSKVSDAANNISVNDGVSSREFDGKIDDVRIYNRVLSAAEITSLYNSGR